MSKKNDAFGMLFTRSVNKRMIDIKNIAKLDDLPCVRNGRKCFLLSPQIDLYVGHKQSEIS